LVVSERDGLRVGVRVTIVGAIVNVLLIGLKAVGGSIGHSQALIADAVHSASDLFTDAVVLFGLIAGRKEPDESHHFGHRRIETLASSIVALLLLGAAIYIGSDAALGIYQHVERRPTWLAVAVAAASIIAKEILYHYTVRTGRRVRSPALIANAWHQRSDAGSSVAVLLGVAGAQINPAWHILDAYAALVVAILILRVGVSLLWSSARELTDAAPAPGTIQRIRECVRGVSGVLDIHGLKVRTAGGLYQIEIDIVVEGSISVAEGHRIAEAVEARVSQEVEDVASVMVHVDPPTQASSS
jgi:cation diffusion facilitator family transporter